MSDEEPDKKRFVSYPRTQYAEIAIFVIKFICVFHSKIWHKSWKGFIELFKIQKSNESATEGETSNSEETNKSRIATAEEIEDLMKHLDGFQHFEKLPAEIKVNIRIFILVYLPFQKMILFDHFNWIEHRKLRLVNKEFKNICESVYNIIISENFISKF